MVDTPPQQTPAPAALAPGLSSNPKRSAAGVTAPGSASGGGGGKRRRTAASSGAAAGPADDAAVLTQRIAELEATVANQGRRIAELEAENATLRKRPRLPTPPAALKQLVGVLGRHEPDLRDMLFDLVCMPRYLARCAAELPADPAGVLGTFAVTVPTGTTAIARDAFTKCEGLAQVTLPALVVVIEAGGWVDVDEDDIEEEDEDRGELRGAFSSCTSLSEITLPPNLTEIGKYVFYQCTSLSEITLPAGPVNIGRHAFAGCPGKPPSP